MRHAVTPIVRRVPVISIHAPQWGATTSSYSIIRARASFQSTHPSGVRPKHFGGGRVRIRFQSTHPSGVRLMTHMGCAHPIEFQSTHPSGVRRHAVSGVFQLFVISIHAPQWGATISITEISSILEFQSTHPSGVRLYRAMLRKTVDMISIHAPQWGATSGLRGRGGFVEISIHAPQWGATHRQHPNQRHPQHFNPRTPVGCDITRYSTFANMPHVAHRLQHVISIHAPQWGATGLAGAQLTRAW